MRLLHPTILPAEVLIGSNTHLIGVLQDDVKQLSRRKTRESRIAEGEDCPVWKNDIIFNFDAKSFEENSSSFSFPAFTEMKGNQNLRA